jgi:hypothetical protein
MLAALLVAPLGAQGRGWSVARSAAADLWFHGLAMTGFEGFGALPLYAPGYADSVMRGRRGAGTRTLLDVRSAHLREAFVSDSAFEVLHFLPLYFPRSDPAAMLAALRRAAEDPARAAAAVGPGERFGVAAALAALPTPAERRVLAEFAEALEDEWRAGYARSAAVTDSARARAALGELERAWRPLEAALSPFLAAHRLNAGVILLVPALGPDGRLFEGDPRASDDNVLAVAWPARAADAAFLAVRELCFPAVRQALATGRSPEADRVEAERLSGTAAVRCGALLLERYAPPAVAGYQAAWLREAGRSGAFAEAFPIPDALLKALDSAIGHPAK